MKHTYLQHREERRALSGDMCGRFDNQRYMNTRPCYGEAYIPTDAEHRANIYTHALLVLPSLAAVIHLLTLSQTNVQFWTAIVYGVSLVLLFSLSSIFHLISYASITGKLRLVFHISDRAIIYLFIAASYTPWMTLREHTIGEGIVWMTWLAALLGVLYQYLFHERYKCLEIVLYLALGIGPSYVVLKMDDHSGVPEVALGGAMYILGIVFFKCDGVLPFAHAVWHCFVVAAASIHYYAVVHYLYNTERQQPMLLAAKPIDGQSFLG